MDEEEIKPINLHREEIRRSRPILLAVLCLFSWVYFGLLSVLFFTATLGSKHIAGVVRNYIPEEEITQTGLLVYFLVAFLLSAMALTGAILIWFLRRPGYYLLSFACLLLAAFQLLQPASAITTTLLYILLILLFGLFYRKLK